MSSPYKNPFHSSSYSLKDHEPYHDDPGMSFMQVNHAKSLPFQSPSRMSDTFSPQHNRLSFRSSAGLIPSPGTVTKRHPRFVRVSSTTSIDPNIGSFRLWIGTYSSAVLGRLTGMCIARGRRNCFGSCIARLR